MPTRSDIHDSSDRRPHRSRRAHSRTTAASSSASPASGRTRRRRGVIAVVKANAYGHGAGQVARALEDAGADLLACADIEEGAALRAAGVRAEILVFGALSVSDLDGLFDCRLTPTISTPGAARAVQAAAAQYKQRAPLPPQDRHRHEPARVPLRQPPPHAAGAARQREPRARRGLHALRDRRRSRSRRSSTSSALRFERALDATTARQRSGARARATGTRRTAPRCCATRASGSTASGPACCSTASCRRRWRRPSRSRR